MDKLEQIFFMQQSFNQTLRDQRQLQDIGMEEWIQRQTLAMVSELSELLDEVNFKWWKNKKPVSETRVKEELVDILHFFVSMCLDAGMDAEELHRMYLEKNKVNFDRQKGLWARTTRPRPPTGRRGSRQSPGTNKKGSLAKGQAPPSFALFGAGSLRKRRVHAAGAPRASLG